MCSSPIHRGRSKNYILAQRYSRLGEDAPAKAKASIERESVAQERRETGRRAYWERWLGR